MNIRVKRVYDNPAKTDGTRLLVDRLWPRGVSKDAVEIAHWAKEFAPSNDLRNWFHQDPEKRFAEFKKKYHSELKKNKAVIEAELDTFKRTITLVTAVKDIERSHIPTLKKFLGSSVS